MHKHIQFEYFYILDLVLTLKRHSQGHRGMNKESKLEAEWNILFKHPPLPPLQYQQQQILVATNTGDGDADCSGTQQNDYG